MSNDTMHAGDPSFETVPNELGDPKPSEPAQAPDSQQPYRLATSGRQPRTDSRAASDSRQNDTSLTSPWGATGTSIVSGSHLSASQTTVERRPTVQETPQGQGPSLVTQVIQQDRIITSANLPNGDEPTAGQGEAAQDFEEMEAHRIRGDAWERRSPQLPSWTKELDRDASLLARTAMSHAGLARSGPSNRASGGPQAPPPTANLAPGTVVGSHHMHHRPSALRTDHYAHDFTHAQAYWAQARAYCARARAYNAQARAYCAQVRVHCARVLAHRAHVQAHRAYLQAQAMGTRPGDALPQATPGPETRTATTSTTTTTTQHDGDGSRWALGKRKRTAEEEDEELWADL
ncbi:hypothetical protein AYL99_09093 [Fonsecaea erecta]|uniref:Uncharacterized protein n=1 Tax=Fonsecaea erecta TaxID=1367422 RepID=A0A178ZBX3_9EURO|nr:hypothetical protein AYL99_09093 [Fonsecaea erecta]OAP56981.1 hypothetical protein AYL99_09093 [Fonsecaea erecta]